MLRTMVNPDRKQSEQGRIATVREETVFVDHTRTLPCENATTEPVPREGGTVCHFLLSAYFFP